MKISKFEITFNNSHIVNELMEYELKFFLLIK